MTTLAFSTPITRVMPGGHAHLSALRPSRRTGRLPTTPVQIRKRQTNAAKTLTWQNCDREAKNRPNDNKPEDDALQSDLQAKVNELFGGRQNVTIDMNTDSEVQFTVNRRSGRALLEQSLDRFRWYVFTSLIVVSVVTGAFFTALYYSGAVHGFDPADDRHYEMPSYGSDSYIDPYELLQRDREYQDSKSQ